MIGVILVAAGSGSRMRGNSNKVFLSLGEQNMVEYCLQTIKKVSPIVEVVVVAAANEVETMQTICSAVEFPFPVHIATGGETRQASVWSGLQTFQMLSQENDVVLVHDCARPLASPDLFYRVIEATLTYGAAIAAVPVKNTIKKSRACVDGHIEVETTVPREELWNVQTPQGFSYTTLKEAHIWAQQQGYSGTDDAALVEAIGTSVSIVEGEYQNIKITTPEDMGTAKEYLHIRTEKPMRIGYGYDVHRFKKGRPCVLGGVTIESPVGPDGHSDADVLIHALMDALLGAAGLRDIGYYFPPTDDAYKNISSLVLLAKVRELLYSHKMAPYNIDVMVIAEQPKISPHVEEMKKNISSVLHIPTNRLSVKATSNEGLGALGRSEGIAAQAVVTVFDREE